MLHRGFSMGYTESNTTGEVFSPENMSVVQPFTEGLQKVEMLP